MVNHFFKLNLRQENNSTEQENLNEVSNSVSITYLECEFKFPMFLLGEIL